MIHPIQVFPGDERISLLRLDLPDPLAGGNKYFKMKYNLEAFRASGKKSVLSFGGAFSNHIAALAAAGKRENIPTTGIIRGEELSESSNAVLRFAQECGMQLRFVSREEYRLRNDAEWLGKLQQEFRGAYILPEGGSNALAVKGCREILSSATKDFDFVFCPVGTGATLAGIIASALPHQQVTGIAVLEGKNYLEEEVLRHLTGEKISCTWQIRHDFTFGGYAKSSAILDAFIREQSHSLPLDQVYSGKCFYAMRKILEQDYSPGGKSLFVHTGGYYFQQAAGF